MARARPLLHVTLLVGIVTPGCSASAEEVCGHIEQLVVAEANEQVAEQAIDGCALKWKMREDTKGLLRYRELAGCVMDAESVEDLNDCE